MGYDHRNDEIRDNIERMQRDWEARRDALATVSMQCFRLKKPFGSGCTLFCLASV